MTNDEEAGWAKINIRQSADELLKYGPSIEVDIRAAINPGPSLKLLAQIDTGADITAISARAAEALKLVPHGADGEIHEAGRGKIVVPYHFIRLTLPHGYIEMEVPRLPSLNPPHDVLIGRDLLRRGLLLVDFVAGMTTLHLKTGG